MDKAFEKYDTNGDGALDLGEARAFLSNWLENELGLDASDANVILQFDDIDLNKDGKIDRNELFSWLKD